MAVESDLEALQQLGAAVNCLFEDVVKAAAQRHVKNL